MATSSTNSVPSAEFFVDDHATTLMSEIADGYIELAKLRMEYDQKYQNPELQTAYKQIMEHKGFLLSQLVVKFYSGAMGAISDLEVVTGAEQTVKLKYSPLT